MMMYLRFYDIDEGFNATLFYAKVPGALMKKLNAALFGEDVAYEILTEWPVKEVNTIGDLLRALGKGSKMTTFTFTQLQEELKPWVQHNFGDRPASQPLRGIAEELGELMDALDEKDEEKAQDGIADCVVFMADYCNGRGYSMGTVLASMKGAPEWSGDHTAEAKQLLKVLGRLNHHDLKKEQGIRKNEDHDWGIVQCLGSILFFLKCLVIENEWPSVEELTEKTWAEVKKRDWKKNAVSGT